MQLRPTFLQGCLISLGGFAFSLLGCMGAATGFSTNGNQTLGFIGAAAALVGLAVLFVGGVLFVIATFKALFGKRDGVS